MMRRYLLLFLMPVFAVVTIGATIYKWVDEKGVVNFSEVPPLGKKTEKIDMPTPQRLQKSGEEQRLRQQPQEVLESSNPLPETVSSRYLVGKGVMFQHHFPNRDKPPFLTSQAIFLVGRDILPQGADLEAHFENPQSSQGPFVVGKEITAGQDIVIISPESSGYKCRNYEVVVYVYGDSTKAKLLDVHRQLNQNLVDIDKATDVKHVLQGRYCP
ncbi:MAG: DUF4124 domain-containing protein [Deltaproteobacteria bacterium]|nr:DUF4124 domain-containing protein [Deltaproteobacteria bacterium]